MATDATEKKRKKTDVSAESAYFRTKSAFPIGLHGGILSIFLILQSLEEILGFPTTDSVVRRQFNITREYNAGDLFSNINLKCVPNYCSTFGATTELDPHCSCRCPITKPIFLQSIQNCTDTIDVCDKVLEFRSENDTLKKAPTLFLPLQNQILNPGAQLNWEEAGVKLNRNGKAPCVTQPGGILTEQGWVILRKKLFQLYVVNSGTFFKWLGTENDSRFLQGKLVQIPIQCRSNGLKAQLHLCAAFRVMGNDVMAKPLALKTQSVLGGHYNPNEAPHPDTARQQRGETGLIVGIICGALLALTLVGVAIFWVVCWKHQKDRLIKRIQMQFLYQNRFAQQNANIYHGSGAYPTVHEPMVMSAAPLEMVSNVSHNGAELYQMATLNGHSNGWIIPTCAPDGGAMEYDSVRQQSAAVDQLPPPPPYPSNLKKKLYFRVHSKIV